VIVLRHLGGAETLQGSTRDHWQKVERAKRLEHRARRVRAGRRRFCTEPGTTCLIASGDPRGVTSELRDALNRSWTHRGRRVSVLVLSTHWSDPAPANVVAEGEIVDPPDEDLLHNEGCAAVKQHATEVLVDLRGVRFIGSAGLNALVRAHDEAECLGCGIAVVGATGLVRRVFEITGLTELFRMDKR
jgi:anti-anti-sigma factor